MTLSRLLTTLLATLFLLFAVYGQADETSGEQITNLDQLLETVREQQSSQQALNALREQEFLKNKQQQVALLAEAKKAFESSQRNNQPLLASTEANTIVAACSARATQGQWKAMVHPK